MGLWLLPFVLNLVVTGWIIGVLTTSLIMRFGQEAEILAWSLVFLFQPISCVFYPLEVLPVWLQAVAWMNPAAHVFEGMRAVLNGTGAPLAHLGVGRRSQWRLVSRMRHCCFTLDVCAIARYRAAGAGRGVKRLEGARS